MLDVLLHLAGAQRVEPEASRHTLLELAQLRPRQHRLEIRLPDKNDLKQRATLVVDVGEQADLFEDVRLQVLSLVDDDDCVGLQRDQGAEKVLQRVEEGVPARRRQPRPIFRDDPEVLEELFQEIVALELRIVDDRDERLPLKPLEHGAAEQRLAGADLSGDDDERFAPFERIGDLVERGCVRRAREHELRVRNQAEWRLAQSEKVLVAHSLHRMFDVVTAQHCTNERGQVRGPLSKDEVHSTPGADEQRSRQEEQRRREQRRGDRPRHEHHRRTFGNRQRAAQLLFGHRSEDQADDRRCKRNRPPPHQVADAANRVEQADVERRAVHAVRARARQDQDPAVQRRPRDGEQPHPQADQRQVEDEQHHVADVEARDQPPHEPRLVLEEERSGLESVLLKRGQQNRRRGGRRQAEREQRHERAGRGCVVGGLRSCDPFDGAVAELARIARQPPLDRVREERRDLGAARAEARRAGTRSPRRAAMASTTAPTRRASSTAIRAAE